MNTLVELRLKQDLAGNSLFSKVFGNLLKKFGLFNRAERIIRDVESMLNSITMNNSRIEQSVLDKYEEKLRDVLPHLTDVIGHLFLKINDLQLSLDEQDATQSERTKRKFARLAREHLRYIHKDLQLLRIGRTRRGVRRSPTTTNRGPR